MEDRSVIEHPALVDVYKLCAEIEEAEARVKLAKQQLHEAVMELPAKIGDNDDLREEIVHHLYWFEDRVPATTLKQAFHVVPPSNAGKNSKNVIKSIQVEITCYDCRQLCMVQAQSKSSHPGICDLCQAKRDKAWCASSQQYQQEHQREQQRLLTLSTMPYYDYLQTPEWQERRKRAMKRAGFRCQVCNAYGVRLNVHHRTYERRGNEQERDLITLCENCHGIFHENGKLAREEVEV